MKTYPIYQATFSGSDERMANVEVQLSAVSSLQAVRRFREWDAEEMGVCGMVGRLVYRDPKHGWRRPSQITPEHLTKDTEIRATRKDWYSTQYSYTPIDP